MSQAVLQPPQRRGLAVPVLGAISVCHLLNDLMQALLPAIYPILKGGFDLSFSQIGVLTLTYQFTASLLQPLIGAFTDRRPQPYSLPFGMGATMCGMLVLGLAPAYPVLIIGAAFMGLGSSVFHPEASRIARLASGGSHGLAQSVFQVGGNFGQSLGPLLAAFFILPHGRSSVAWFALVALTGIVITSTLGRWYVRSGHSRPVATSASPVTGPLSAGRVRFAMTILIALLFSKYIYLASFTSYYTFYLMEHFGLTTQAAQIDLFIFLGAAAAGTVVGGPVGDRLGRKAVIWGSILGILPFTLALPYVGLHATIVLSAIIAFILSSAFSAIIVYAQELMPGRVGTVSGLFFGLAFGIAGIGAGALGILADHTSIDFVYRVCAFLPLIGILTMFLPDTGRAGR